MAILVNFLIFVLASIGMTHIIVEGYIFTPIRELLRDWLPDTIFYMFECSQCIGFWVGLFCGWVMISNNILIVFLLGCAGSYLANRAQWDLLALEASTVGIDDEEI